jgi:hypothetical protein
MNTQINCDVTKKWVKEEQLLHELLNEIHVGHME